MADFDLDVLIAEREAVPDFVIRFGGEDYTCPGEMDLRVLSLMTQGMVGPALQRMLGAEQMAQLNKAGGVLPARMMWGILDAYAKHSGIDVGEASASAAS